MCVFFKKLTNTVQINIYFLFEEREKLVYVLLNQVGSMIFNIFTKVSLSNVV